MGQLWPKFKPIEKFVEEYNNIKIIKSGRCSCCNKIKKIISFPDKSTTYDVYFLCIQCINEGLMKLKIENIK